MDSRFWYILSYDTACLYSCIPLSSSYRVFTTDGTLLPWLIVVHWLLLLIPQVVFPYPLFFMFPNFSWTSSLLANLLIKTILYHSLPLLALFIIVTQVSCLVRVVGTVGSTIWTLFVYFLSMFLLLVLMLCPHLPLLIFGILGQVIFPRIVFVLCYVVVS